VEENEVLRKLIEQHDKKYKQERLKCQSQQKKMAKTLNDS